MEDLSDPLYRKSGYRKPLESDGECDAYDRLVKEIVKAFRSMVEHGKPKMRPRHNAQEWFEEKILNNYIPKTSKGFEGQGRAMVHLDDQRLGTPMKTPYGNAQ